MVEEKELNKFLDKTIRIITLDGDKWTFEKGQWSIREDRLEGVSVYDEYVNTPISNIKSFSIPSVSGTKW